MSSSQRTKKSQISAENEQLSSIANIMTEVRDLLKELATNIQGTNEIQGKTEEKLKEIHDCLTETVNQVSENTNNPNSSLIDATNEVTIEK